MELKEFIEINNLLTIYKELLSPKQKQYLEDYFENDFSLSEIAKDNNISRQAVYDNIKKSIKILNDYEAKLKIIERQKNLRAELLNLKSNFKQENLDKIMEDFF